VQPIREPSGLGCWGIDIDALNEDCCFEEASLGFCPKNQNMTHVGSGKGKWIAETTYVYVGEGKGDLEFEDNLPGGGQAMELSCYERNKCIAQSLCIICSALGFLALYIFLMHSFAATGGEVGPHSHLQRSHAKMYDCSADFADRARSWSREKRHWCCKAEQLGCAAAAAPVSDHFDCLAGYDNWAEEWSHDKSVWCCRFAGRACSAG